MLKKHWKKIDCSWFLKLKFELVIDVDLMDGKWHVLTHHRPAMPFGNRKKYFRGSFQHDSKNINPPGNLKFDYLRIFPSLKLRISMEKNPLNFY